MASEGTADRVAAVERGAIVLCGGRSSRMGLPKLGLPFGDETMLHRVARLLATVAGQVLVVAAPDQQVPPLPAGVLLARDRRAGRGPLEGLAAGLAALPAEVAAAFVTSCDVPLLVPALVERMFDLLGEARIAVPRVEGFYQPLSGVYRRNVLPVVERLLAADRLRPLFLFDEVAVRVVAPTELTDVDPTLASLRNLNRPEDYLAALAEAGYTAPAEVLSRLGDQAAPKP